MTEYIITSDDLIELQELINKGFEITKIKTYRGCAEIHLHKSKDGIHSDGYNNIILARNMSQLKLK